MVTRPPSHARWVGGRELTSEHARERRHTPRHLGLVSGRGATGGHKRKHMREIERERENLRVSRRRGTRSSCGGDRVPCGRWDHSAMVAEGDTGPRTPIRRPERSSGARSGETHARTQPIRRILLKGSPSSCNGLAGARRGRGPHTIDYGPTKNATRVASGATGTP